MVRARFLTLSESYKEGKNKLCGAGLVRGINMVSFTKKNKMYMPTHR